MNERRRKRNQTWLPFDPFTTGAALVAIVALTWIKALGDGGFWWIVFIAVVLFAIVIGEKVKQELEALVQESRTGSKESKTADDGRGPGEERTDGPTNRRSQ